ncbi:thioredoxin family protein [Methylotenera sp. L2L1]|uniref:thioredoxin family protein n=1 Tax=Methylotenera sp. L2L1 TaxID=1502770 RepID=UPI00055CF2E9|nr:thioredoxin family protein [Methylotenera sp. L2L1]
MHPTPPINREFLDQLSGLTIVEFGAEWCGYCQAAQSIINNTITGYPDIKHIKIEDGKGQRLGRTYAVKLWPTLIFLKDGIEVNRVVRPSNEKVIAEALATLK